VLQKKQSIPIGLVMILGLVLSQGADAREEVQAQESPADSAPGQTDDTANESKRVKFTPAIEAPSIEPMVLEEVVVTAARVEGGGKGRRTVASRKDLDESDRTDMESFFDDIDGLSTLGGDDEGNAFSINGLSPDLSMVTLDGQGFGQGRGSGGLGAGDLPTDMILRVDIFKTPTASMEEGGSGGLVNLQMRSPLQIPQPSTSIRGKLAYVPEKGNFGPAANIFLGRPSESKKFGYMLSVNLDDRTREYGSQIVSSWELQEYDGRPAFVPRQVRSDAVKIGESRILGSLVLGFRPHESLEVNGKLILSQRRKDTESHSLQHRLEKQRDITALAFDDRIVSELVSSDRSRRNLRISGSMREDEVESQMLTLDFTWRHKGWRTAGVIGYNIDENTSHKPSQTATFDVNNSFGYVANKDGSLSMFYPQGFPPDQDFLFSRINLSERNTKDTNGFGGIDVIRGLGQGFFRRVRFGGKFREMSRSRGTYTGNTDVDDDLTLEDFFSGQYRKTPWDTVVWPSADMDTVNTAVQESDITWKQNLLNQYDIKRQTGAGYLQADFRASLKENRFLVGNIGARIVNTETWINGFQNHGEGTFPFSQKNTYSDILPSLSMRVRVAERTALTLGAARVMTHPAFNDLAPGIRINNADKTAKSGNPDLEPFRANQYLAELTWAPVRGRRLSGMLSYRDAESFFVRGEESIEINDATFIVMRPINGYNGSILSASIKLDQNLRRMTRYLRSFDLSLSYTYNDSRTQMKDPYTGETLPMPATAEHVARAGLYYSRDIFSGNLVYQWRGRSLKSSFSESGLSVWNQPVGSLNLSLGWRLSGIFQLGIDARNLLSEDQLQTTDDSGQLLRITERNRMFSATLRARW